MKSLILTSLYLIKDTIYRWKERPSSALSRLLVVFFLSLCALSFLGNYVLMTRSIENEIRRSGGDLIILVDTEMLGATNKVNLIKNELPALYDIDLFIFNEIGLQGFIGDKSFPIVEYGDEGLSGLKDFPLDEFPYMALLPEDSTIPIGPAVLNVYGYNYNLVTRKIPQDHVLDKVYKYGVVLVPEGVADGMKRNGLAKRYLIKVNDMTYDNIKGIEDALKNVCRMDGSMSSSVWSSAPLLSRLSVMMSNQNECRAGFSIGIAVIVGILLTSIASMEFRENEYVYTLMKSFGVRPFLLVFTFIMENLFLVGCSFTAAIFFFLKSQKIIVREFFKINDALLSVSDLYQDLFLLGSSLVICVLVSALPIAVSAYREIGRVLK